MKIHLIAAARPNFMKIAPLYHGLNKSEDFEPVIVHTGQHYDLNMSHVFFENLNLPRPHIHLGVGSGTHAFQTGNVMIAYEKVLFDEKPDLTVVVGDVNSTAAAALAAAKLGVKTAHLEAGLRSFDRTMPEEINRIVTDAVCDILWTPSPDGSENLLNEGVAREKIRFVGNIMIDALEMMRDRIEAVSVYEQFNCEKGRYGLVTLHRPSNVDNPETLETLCDKLAAISENIPLIFPVHPRTVEKLETHNLHKKLEGFDTLHLAEPLGYIDFMNLLFNAGFAVTDSGGIQEETTYLGIPCLTLRPNTERPVTITLGTNRLCTPETLLKLTDEITAGQFPKGSTPDLWDGNTAGRIVNSLKKDLIEA